jgi:hypothetical protein
LESLAAVIEDRDVARFRRELSALMRHANDAEGFAQAVELIAEARGMLADQARSLMAEGFSAAEMARPLRISRQAYHKRWIQEPSTSSTGGR